MMHLITISKKENVRCGNEKLILQANMERSKLKNKANKIKNALDIMNHKKKLLCHNVKQNSKI